MDKNKLIIGILSFALIGVLSTVGVGAYQDSLREDKAAAYNQGAMQGYQTAIVDVARMATSCEAVPLRIGNETIDMIAVECLKMAQSQQGQVAG